MSVQAWSSWPACPSWPYSLSPRHACWRSWGSPRSCSRTCSASSSSSQSPASLQSEPLKKKINKLTYLCKLNLWTRLIYTALLVIDRTLESKGVQVRIMDTLTQTLISWTFIIESFASFQKNAIFSPEWLLPLSPHAHILLWYKKNLFSAKRTYKFCLI